MRRPASALPQIRVVPAGATDAPPLADVVAVSVLPGGSLGPDALALGSELDVDLAAYADQQKASGDPGRVVTLPRTGTPRLVLLAGIGDASPKALRTAGAAIVRHARDIGPLSTSIAATAGADALRALVEGVGLAAYSFTLKTTATKPKLARVTVTHDGDAGDAVARGEATVGAVVRARDLANTPSMEKSPKWLADAAAALASTALTVKVRGERELAAEGFNGILAVGAGSTRGPRLAELRYAPRGARTHVVLVGKGITFDSGGLSLKPSDGMIAMKTDMAGGAAVLGVMGALADLGVGARVTALVPIAENMPSGSAQRPGDVIRHYDGRTVEVLNTDAEGRLVLADAIGYAAAKLQPDVIVDLATLTGAATLGLSRYYGALYATDDELANALVAAANDGGERLWRMPLNDDYRDALDSDVADLRNIGDPGSHYSGGSITAALFLREFTAGRRWAHLDIAGPARSDKDDGEITKGATGYGVRLLLRWLETL
jgi:leucyl aminopeptidase